MTKTCPRCGILSTASATRCDCGSDLSAATEPRERVVNRTSMLGLAGPLLLVFGAFSMCSDFAINNDFAAYDRNKETLLGDLGVLMFFSAPATGLLALALDRSRKKRDLPGLSRVSYFVNALIVVVAAMYAVSVVPWLLIKR